MNYLFSYLKNKTKKPWAQISENGPLKRLQTVHEKIEISL